MNNLSKFFILSLDQAILKMDEVLMAAEQEMDYDFGDDVELDDDEDLESDEEDLEDEDEDLESDDDDLESDDEDLEDDDEDLEDDDEDLEDEDEDLDEDLDDDDDFDDLEDVDDDIYAHSPISDESIIDKRVASNTFAFSTKDSRQIALQQTDWATIARLSESGMDRIFIDGKEVFVAGFNKILLKTDRNIKKMSEDLKSRGLSKYAERVEQLMC